jgi:hypothetical protein
MKFNQSELATILELVEESISCLPGDDDDLQEADHDSFAGSLRDLRNKIREAQV